jgi:hypothetical protein
MPLSYTWRAVSGARPRRRGVDHDPPRTRRVDDVQEVAGVHSFGLTNDGKEPHMMVLSRKNDGVTESFDEPAAMPEEEALTKATIVGQGFAAPGESGHVLADLAPGEYLAMCPPPTGWFDMSGPPPDGPPHLTQGMTHQFVVE